MIPMQVVQSFHSEPALYVSQQTLAGLSCDRIKVPELFIQNSEKSKCILPSLHFETSLFRLLLL